MFLSKFHAGGGAALWILGLLQSLHLLSFSLLMPLGPQFARVWHLSPLEFGILAAAYPLSAGVAGLTTLVGTRHLPGKRSIVVPGIAFALALTFSALATDYSWLLVGRVFAGIMGGLFCAWLPDVVARTVTVEGRSQSLRHALATQPFWTLSLGLPLLLGVAWKWGWAMSFIVLAGVSFLTVMTLAILLPAIHRGEKELRTHVRSMMILLQHSGYRSVFVMSCALTGSGAVVVTFFSGIMVINMNLGEKNLALLFLCGGLVTLLALPVMEKLVVRWDPWALFIGISVASAVSIVWLMRLPLHQTGWAVTAGVLFMVTTALRFVPAGRLWQKHLKPRHAERFVGLQGVLQQVVAGVAMITAGILMGRAGNGPLEGYERLGTVALVTLAVAVSLAWWEFRKKGANE